MTRSWLPTIERIEYNRRQFLYNKALLDLRREAEQAGKEMTEDEIQQSAIIRAYDAMEKAGTYVMPEHHRNAYKTVGGTPFLDGVYTVSGRSGERAEHVWFKRSTDRPVQDIRIVKVKIIK